MKSKIRRKYTFSQLKHIVFFAMVAAALLVGTLDNPYTTIAAQAAEKSTVANIGTPVISSIKNDGTEITVTWSKVDGASGYYVYSSLDDMSYRFLGGTVKTSYIENYGIGSKVSFKIVAYKKASDGTITKGNVSDFKSAKVGLKAAVITETERISATKGKVTWNEVSCASGYYVYRAYPGKPYSFVGATQYNTYFTDTKLESGKTYYYKVVAFCKYNGDQILKAPASNAANMISGYIAIKSITRIGYTGAKIDYTAVNGAQRYIIYAARPGDVYADIETSTTTSVKSYDFIYRETAFIKVQAVTVQDGVVKKGMMSAGKGIKFIRNTGDPAKLTDGQKQYIAKAIAKEIAACCRRYGDTDFEQARIAAIFVKSYCSIDTYTSDDKDYRTGYGVFVKGVYTCSGATRALGLVLDELGIKWTHANENQWTHQWNDCKFAQGDGWADGMAGQAGYYN